MNQVALAPLTDGAVPETPYQSIGTVFMAAGAAAALSACGGGEAATGDVPVPEVYPANTAQAARFLGQADFGANETTIAHVMQTGYSAWLKEQIALPTSQSHWDWLIEKGFNARGNNNTNINGNGGWDQSLWRKLFASPDGPRQKMVLAWSELFVVSAIGLPVQWKNFAIANYLDTLERLAFGNFRDLLEAVTLSSAMGTYLTMKGNKKAVPSLGRVPDENYAREVMQLFTIGLYQLNTDGSIKRDSQGLPLETYTNADTQGLAAVFTGWRLSAGEDATARLEAGAYQHGLPMQLDEGLHSQIEKKFLGVTIPANTPGEASLKIALDTLFNHANTGPFIAKHFIQRLVTSNPSPAYVQRVAAVFANNGQRVRGDMAAVFKAVLLDSEARADSISPTFGKLREPVARLLQWGRTFGAASADGLWNMGFTNSEDSGLGQMPLYAPSVFNFFRPGYAPPNTEIANQGLVAPEFQILTEPTVVSYINYMTGTINNGRAVKVVYTAEQEIARDIPTLVDRYNLWLAAGQLSAASLQTIKAAVQSIIIPTTNPSAALLNRIYATITLVMSCPEYLIQK
jgi:uncharacterized protein (DUF1800 family)